MSTRSPSICTIFPRYDRARIAWLRPGCVWSRFRLWLAIVALLSVLAVSSAEASARTGTLGLEAHPLELLAPDGLLGHGAGVGASPAARRPEDNAQPVIPAWILLPDEASALRGVLHPPTLVAPAHGRIEFDSAASVGQLVSFFKLHFARAGFDIRIATEPITPALGVRAGLAADHAASGRSLDIIIHELAGQRLVRMRYRGS